MYKPKQGNIFTDNDYIEYPVSNDLKKMVACFWWLEPRDNGSFLAIPDACVDLVFELSSPNRIYLIGSHTKYREFSISHNTKYLGLRFMPGAINNFIDIDLSFSKNTVIQLDSLGELTINKIISSISILENKDRCKSQIEEWIRSNLKNNIINQNVMCVINEVINKNGEIALDDSLSATTELCSRQVRRVVRKLTGLSLKEISRIIRFQSALKKLTEGRNVKVDYGEVFFDQSHMIREFKCFTGFTPKKFIKMSVLSN